jgi:hypothetical protein
MSSHYVEDGRSCTEDEYESDAGGGVARLDYGET